jgi:CelD/BcsL family acetyltransferase involved in cellulose biosynthesis
LDFPHLFFSFDWCWNAWKLVAEGRGYKLRLVTGMIDGRLVLIWPLMVDNSVLRLLSSEILEYRDVIVEPSEHASRWVEQAWSYVLATMEADLFIFQNLRHPNALARKLARVSNASRIGGGWCPLIRLDHFANWDAYATTLPKSLLSDQRRQWKRVRQTLPGISFQLIKCSDMIEPVISWIGQHKAAWAKARGDLAVWFHSKDIRVFLGAVAELRLNEGNFILAKLSDGDTTISAGWGYVCESEFLFHAFAYDPAYATYSPSRLFIESLVRWCFQNNIRSFDFMPGEEQYKRIWATDYVCTESYIGPLTLRGAWLLKLARLKPAGTRLIKGLHRMLPSHVRDIVRGRLRSYWLVRGALSLKLAPPRPPQKSSGTHAVK